MASQVKTGCQQSGCWHSTKGSVNFEQNSEKMEYFEHYVLNEWRWISQICSSNKGRVEKNGLVIMIPLVFMVINMNHDELTDY